MKGNWWDVQAGKLQAAVRASQIERAEQYSDEDARRSVVYTREDTVLIVAHLSALNLQVSMIKVILMVLTSIAFLALLKYLF